MRFPILLLLPVLALTGCATVRNVNLYSEPQELAIGEYLAREVESQYPLLHDAHLQWYLEHLGTRLAQHSSRPNIPYSFKLVKSPEINAFTLAGGHIYVNLGSLQAVGQENELAGLLAHEIGHAAARHLVKKLTQYQILSTGAYIALGPYPNRWAALAANLFGSAGLLRLSRDVEREADELGVNTMVQAGYDAQGMIRLFELLIERYHRDPGPLEKLFATHPPSEERIQNIKTQLAGMTLPQGLLVTSPEFERMKARVDSLYPVKEEKEKGKSKEKGRG